jgi:predicted O-methyltransferase YrrM
MLKKILPVLAILVISAAVVESLTAQPGRRGGDFGGRRGGRGLAGSTRQYAPTAVNAEERKILDVLEDMDRTQRRGNMNVPTEDGRILRLLTEAAGAKHVVEIGTSNGYSGIWFCLGLRATGGKLTTHEIDERRAALARENFKRAGVEDIVTLVMGNAHDTVTRIKEPIDIIFIDADKEGYLDYLEKLLPLVRGGGLILSHNMNMLGQDYIKAITEDPNLETVFAGQGDNLGITLKKRLSE